MGKVGLLAGLKSGLLLASVALLAAAGGIALTWRVMNAERREFVQQSIGDTTGFLASFAAHELTRLIQEAEREGRKWLASGATPVGGIEQDTGLLDLAIWTRSGQSADAPPVRARWAFNSRVVPSSGELRLKLEALEASDKGTISAAFGGRTVVAWSSRIEAPGVALVAIPIGEGNAIQEASGASVKEASGASVKEASGASIKEASGASIKEVIGAHLRLAGLQGAFGKETFVRGFLVDSHGVVLAHADPTEVGKDLSAHPLVRALAAGAPAASPMEYGGSRQIPVGGLGVVASVPQEEIRSGLEWMRRRSMLFLVSSFLCFFAIGFTLGRRRALRTVPLPAGASPSAAAADSSIASEASERTTIDPERKVITALHGSIADLEALLEGERPDQAAEAISDFLTFAAQRTRSSGASFEHARGGSFVAIWEGDAAAAALRCALDFRRDLAALNESRKVDGKRVLRFSMGVDCGQGLAARMGAAGSMKGTWAGPALLGAEALDQLCRGNGVDLLVSQSVWQSAGTQFLGKSIGEARLTPGSGLTAYYELRGYRDESGAEVLVETPYSAYESERPIPAGEKRWLVNNGSQIVGPHSAGELAARLFSQELDFDSECWLEGTGESSRIDEAGIFGQAKPEPGATLWVYDGKTLHGPLSRGFLMTAQARGAIPSDAHVCESSTIRGWRPLGKWIAEATSAEASGPPSLAAAPAPKAATPVATQASAPTRAVPSRPTLLLRATPSAQAAPSPDSAPSSSAESAGSGSAAKAA